MAKPGEQNESLSPEGDNPEGEDEDIEQTEVSDNDEFDDAESDEQTLDDLMDHPDRNTIQLANTGWAYVKNHVEVTEEEDPVLVVQYRVEDESGAAEWKNTMIPLPAEVESVANLKVRYVNITEAADEAELTGGDIFDQIGKPLESELPDNVNTIQLPNTGWKYSAHTVVGTEDNPLLLVQYTMDDESGAVEWKNTNVPLPEGFTHAEIRYQLVDRASVSESDEDESTVDVTDLVNPPRIRRDTETDDTTDGKKLKGCFFKGCLIPAAIFAAGATSVIGYNALFPGGDGAGDNSAGENTSERVDSDEVNPDGTTPADGRPQTMHDYSAGAKKYFINDKGDFIIPSSIEGVIIGEHASDFRLRQIEPTGLLGTVVLDEDLTYAEREKAIDTLKQNHLPDVYARALQHAIVQGFDGFNVKVQEVRNENKVTLEASIQYFRGVE